MVNANLPGLNAPAVAAREAQFPPAVQQRASDVACVVGVDTLADRQAIIAAGKAGRLPYGYNAATDLSTPITNPANQNGVVPPAPTVPPCGTVDSSLVDAAFQCMEQHCSTKGAGDGTGELQGTTDCLVSNCAAQLVNVQGASVACYDCVVDYVASGGQFGPSEQACRTDVRPPLAFQGQNDVTILSHYPLVNTDVLVLPSTNFRRVVEYAQLQLPDRTVDFYCGFFNSTLNASALPYVGNYGNGTADSQGSYDNEQTYEAQQLVTWVQKKSGTRPAIVVGDWRSSVAATGSLADAGGALAPLALNPPTLQALQGAPGWTAATLPGWAPQCNVCPGPQNPYNSGTDVYFVEQPFLVSWPGTAGQATTSESFIFNADTVPLGDGGSGPLTAYYGLNVQVSLP